VYGGSLLLHAGLAIGTIVLPKPKQSETVAITLAEEKRKKDPPKPPPPPPPPPPKPEEKPKPRPAPQSQQQQQAKVVPEAKAEAPPPVAVDEQGFADLGMALGNSDGPGLAVPAAVAAAAPATKGTTPRPVATTHTVEKLAPAQGAAACTDPVVRPKRKVPVAPKYTMQARQAEIEGVVRVEVTVDESGRVIHARVLAGLGYGLDEAALEAAKATVFDPAMQCGKPVVGTAILPFRFEET
jgi:protein TonB